jgi:ubiquinol-cytochrome c reductase cytochrome b/c1 subunit
LFRIFFWLFVATVIGLGYVGSQPPEGWFIVAGRVLTISYFAFFFIVLPFLPLFETPKKLPASIAESVLGAPAPGKV